MNLPASPRSLSRSANFGLLRIDRGLDRMADGIERSGSPRANASRSERCRDKYLFRQPAAPCENRQKD